MNLQQGDVKLFQIPDGGEIHVVNGTTEMTADFSTMAYLALFGGNEEDDGGDQTTQQFWGNGLETDPDFKIRSETQHLLRSIPATSSNLLRVKDASSRDLAVFTNKKIASSVEVEVTIPALDRVNISGTILAEGEEERFNFTENWKASV